MGPERKFYLAPGEKNVRMVVDALGEFTDAIGEREGVAKIFELEFFFQMVLVHNPPAGAQLSRQIGKLATFKRRTAAFAGYAFLFSQSTHGQTIGRNYPSVNPVPATTSWTGRRFRPSVFPMSKAAKATDSAKAEALPFEEALKRLETIVEAMEKEDLPLETLIARYEEGTRLARACQAKLTEADLKIQKLEKNRAGDMTLKPLPPDLLEQEP